MIREIGRVTLAAALVGAATVGPATESPAACDLPDGRGTVTIDRVGGGATPG